MTIDWTKPVQTRDGRKVRVLCTDVRGNEDTVAGVITHENGVETVESWQTGGAYGLASNETDLINVPETRVVWVNMYAEGSASEGRPELSRSIADRNAAHAREARIRVEYTVGQFDEEGDG